VIVAHYRDRDQPIRNPAATTRVHRSVAVEPRLRRRAAALPTGSDELAVRRRYLRQRRRLAVRAWATVWVAAAAVMGWLFIAGFAGLGH